jgi:hypothetical protein
MMPWITNHSPRLGTWDTFRTTEFSNSLYCELNNMFDSELNTYS